MKDIERSVSWSRFFTYYLVVGLIAVSILIINQFNYYEEIIEDNKDICEFHMTALALKCDYPTNIKWGNAGIYRYLTDDINYYCVNTAKKSFEQIVSTDPYLNDVQLTAIHEIQHEMISKDYEHFCDEKWRND